jgi:hypothetical protein
MTSCSIDVEPLTALGVNTIPSIELEAITAFEAKTGASIDKGADCLDTTGTLIEEAAESWWDVVTS